MGIPSYFYNIIQTYGNKFFGSKKACKRLFLDLNCCIHGCKNRILSTFKGDITTKEGNIQFENEVIEEVIQTILRFCKHTKPTELLWIAVDGVVPLAKMVQQRERRSRAVEDKKHIQDIYIRNNRIIPPQWDSNAITPGTPFMLHMCDVIQSKLPMIRKQSGVSNIEMCGVRIPGEGEQKIFDYIRQHPGNDIETEDIVYGLDADLIILSLLQSIHPEQKSPISLLREEQAFGKLVQDTVTGEDVLVRFSVSEFGKVIPIEWSGINDPTLIYDYIVLMSLMGNDFVPHTPSLTFRSEGMLQILDAYRHVDERLVDIHTIINNTPVIRWKILSKILYHLEKSELKTLMEDAKKINQIRKRIQRGEVPFRHAIRDDPVEQEIVEMDWVHLRQPDTIKAGEDARWKTRYYRQIAGCYGDTMNIQPVVSNVCNSYLNSIWWCWMYYNGGIVPGDICYSFASGPLLEDAAKLAQNWEPASPDPDAFMVSDIPVEAQLLVVLPPESHHILPSWVQQIAKQCLDLYPNDSKMWSYGKRHIWECTAILPRLPIRRITRMIKMTM
jgi:5'-3' exonuclease